jgi:hypothetical protein
VFDRIHTCYTRFYLSTLSNASNVFQYIQIMTETAFQQDILPRRAHVHLRALDDMFLTKSDK